MLTTRHYPHSSAAAAIDRYLLPARPTAANLQHGFDAGVIPCRHRQNNGWLVGCGLTVLTTQTGLYRNFRSEKRILICLIFNVKVRNLADGRPTDT